MASGNTRLSAAALLAVSAGACVGLALSFTPAATSLYAATGVQPITTARVSTVQYPTARLAAVGSVQAVNQMQGVTAPIAQASNGGIASTLALVLGGFSAAAAAAAAVLKFQSTSSEQVAMLAASGKKSAPKNEARPLWYPTAEPPAWLDGSLPGDRGFDPLGLAKPTEFLQYDLDALDQNAGKNRAGGVIGRVAGQPDSVSTDALQPYSEVFGLQRFRECELIHGRWAMLAVLGCLVSEAVTGVAWQNAGLVEVTNGATYFGFNLPFSSNQVIWFEVLAMGAIEVFRNTELNPEKRCYPGGAFDPLGLASKDEATTFRLKEAELKHGRLAMISFLGFAAAALNTGFGATQSFGEWATTTFN